MQAHVAAAVKGHLSSASQDLLGLGALYIQDEKLCYCNSSSTEDDSSAIKRDTNIQFRSEDCLPDTMCPFLNLFIHLMTFYRLKCPIL